MHLATRIHRRLLTWAVAVCMATLLAGEGLAATLQRATVASRGRNGALVVLRFDERVDLSLVSSEGRGFRLEGGDLDARGAVKQLGSFVTGVDVAGGMLIINSERYVRARLVPAGAGTYLLYLNVIEEPEARQPSQTPTANTSQPSDTQPPTEAPPQPLEAPAGTTSRQDQGSRDVTTPEQAPADNEQDMSSFSKGGTRGGPAPGADPILDLPSTRVQFGDLGNLPTTIKVAHEIAQQGNTERAIGLLETIQQNEPEFAWSQVMLGRLKQSDGDFSSALDHYREAMRYEETREIAAVRIAIAFQAMENYDASAGMWEQVLAMNGGTLVLPAKGSPEATEVEVAPEEEDGFAFADVVASIAGINRTVILVGIGVFVLALATALFFIIKAARRRKMGDRGEFSLEEELGMEGEIDLDATPVEGPDSVQPDDVDLDSEEFDLEQPGDMEDPFADEPAGSAGEEEPEAGGGEGLSMDKRQQVQEMHQQGQTVREIAESLGLGQDEVRMAISLAETGGE